MSRLAISNLGVRFGGVDALSDVSLAVISGEVAGLIGPNGAGKTTLVNVASGFVPAHTGSISLDDVRLDGKRPFEIARAGVLRTYQNIRLFGALSVRENIRAGAMRSRDLADEDLRLLLGRAGLGDLGADAVASALPYGDQRRLEIARALAGDPRILMLDEPAAGMNSIETRKLGELIRSIAADGIGVLLIEHDVGLVRAVCDRIFVLNFGTLLADGTPEEIARNPDVIEAYLGVVV